MKSYKQTPKSKKCILYFRNTKKVIKVIFSTKCDDKGNFILQEKLILAKK